MKLGTKGLMPGMGNQNFVRSTGVPESVTVKRPKKLNTATDFRTNRASGATAGDAANPVSKLKGMLVQGRGGGIH